MTNTQSCLQRSIHLYSFCEREHIATTNTKKTCEKISSKRVLGCWVAKCIKKNQIEMYEMLTHERQPIQQKWSRLLWNYQSQVPSTHFAKRCCFFTCLTKKAEDIEVQLQRVMSSCSYKIYLRHDYPSTIVGENGTNIVFAANELNAFEDKKRRLKLTSLRKQCLDFQPSGRTTVL